MQRRPIELDVCILRARRDVEDLFSNIPGAVYAKGDCPNRLSREVNGVAIGRVLALGR